MLRVVPLGYKDVVAFVELHHRHNKKPRGGKVFLGLMNSEGLVGVACLGRPSARAYDRHPVKHPTAKLIAEVTRTCTTGYPNANSRLYGACRQIAKSMGYDKIITYTEEGESGASLKAAGFVMVKKLPPRKNWQESSKKLAHLRDKDGRGNVTRYRWEISFARPR